MFSAQTLFRRIVVVALLILTSLLFLAAVPRGWFLAGNKPSSYETGIDAQVSHNSHRGAYLKSKEPSVDGFGTLMQQFRADHYLGKRVRFSAFVKTADVQSWACLWMRIDKDSTQLAFDNMQNRPIKGTTDWQKYDVVLNVPHDATGIFFGILLGGTGQAWISDANFEVVGSDGPTSGSNVTPTMPDEPSNLNFEN